MSREQDDEWLKIEYRECSNDLRHFGQLSWAIPATVLAVAFLATQFVLGRDNRLPMAVNSLVLFGAGLFGLILTVNFLKYVRRSGERRSRLIEIAKDHKELRRFPDDEPWPYGIKLGYPTFVFLLIVSLSLLASAFVNLICLCR